MFRSNRTFPSADGGETGTDCTGKLRATRGNGHSTSEHGSIIDNSFHRAEAFQTKSCAVLGAQDVSAKALPIPGTPVSCKERVGAHVGHFRVDFSPETKMMIGFISMHAQ